MPFLSCPQFHFRTPREETMLKTIALAAASALLLAACASTPAPTTIADTAARSPQLSTLNRLIADAGLADTLRGPGPFTVFAPTDEAFKAVPARTLAELTQNKDRLKAVLTYHVLPGSVKAADVKNGAVKTVNGANVAVARSGTFVTFDEALVTQADVVATNGVVHLIDKVILPPGR
jgi:uncharacterized surface protein with fasciclin (FAS1) repeats